MTSPFKSDILSGKVVLVTGGGTGIGREIAKQFGKHGARVAVLGRRLAPLQETVKEFAQEGIATIAVQGDVRDFNSCTAAVGEVVSQFGRLDALVNNAAGNFLSAAEDLSTNGLRTVLEIDTLGTFNMSRAALPALKEARNSVIINITAVLGNFSGAFWYQAHASAAKAAIDSLTRSLALEWGEYGVRVCGIAPGAVSGTVGFEKLTAGASAEVVAQHHPLRRIPTTEDIALNAVYLASHAAHFVTGVNLIVDAGSTVWQIPPAPREVIRQFSRNLEAEKKKAKL
eukprot:TRINITY_DN10952_c0_g1_i1.p1 TRINITY_DN10952_c0_g1~~TRINITY_DN10952_c0_g1_i1.p1  ORF type:complete len:285 (-),score=56.80 TRINITY_DN10952_c0_g1_i1:103-957(-)